MDLGRITWQLLHFFKRPQTLKLNFKYFLKKFKHSFLSILYKYIGIDVQICVPI
jgi:hypothetical protein